MRCKISTCCCTHRSSCSTKKVVQIWNLPAPVTKKPFNIHLVGKQSKKAETIMKEAPDRLKNTEEKPANLKCNEDGKNRADVLLSHS